MIGVLAYAFNQQDAFCMIPYHASYYFDLKKFAHGPFVDDCQYVWEALNKLRVYLSNYPFAKLSTNFPGVTFVNSDAIFIGEGTTIESGAYIEGPCVIGKNCQIRHAAYIRGNVLIGDECVIGHCTELKNAILMNKVHIAHLSYGGDSIYGHGCNVGAGTKCANLKLDGQVITARFPEGNYQTGMRKLGAILGDGTQLGCNSVTNPGTFLGKNCHLYPCTNFGGFAPENSRIRSEARAIIKQKGKL